MAADDLATQETWVSATMLISNHAIALDKPV